MGTVNFGCDNIKGKFIPFIEVTQGEGAEAVVVKFTSNKQLSSEDQAQKFCVVIYEILTGKHGLKNLKKHKAKK